MSLATALAKMATCELPGPGIRVAGGPCVPLTGLVTHRSAAVPLLLAVGALGGVLVVLSVHAALLWPQVDVRWLMAGLGLLVAVCMTALQWRFPRAHLSAAA